MHSVALKTPLAEPPRETHAVFVDSSGRRMRVARRVGLTLGLALTVCLGALGVSLVADADVPFTPWTDGGAVKQSRGAEPRPKSRERAERLNPATVPGPAVASRPPASAAPSQAPGTPAATALPSTPGNRKAVGKTTAPGQSRKPRQPAQ